jgi:HEAT repeat protein
MLGVSLFLVAAILSAQDLRIGTIEFLGLRKVSEEQIRSVLGLREGDTIPMDSPGEWLQKYQKRIEGIPGVVRASISARCCDGAGKAALTVSILEEGSPSVTFRPVPTSSVRLPKEIIETYHRFTTAWEHAVRIGDNEDNIEEGHSLMANADVREIQREFITLARKHFAVLRTVLRNSAADEHRTAAAWTLGYAPDKAAVVDDLVHAVSDASEEVRNNAARAVWAIATLSTRKPELGIHIPVGPFIELLNSIVWSDRNKALAVLGEITRDRPPATMTQLRQHALAALVEMARRRDGATAYLLLGRIAGIPEEQITETWNREEREKVIAKLLRGE